MTKAKTFRIWDFGHCYLFDIWNLLFGIFLPSAIDLENPTFIDGIK
jgi:hypothetical protein